MSLTSLGIAAEDAELLFRALHDGAMNLLTGAGASYGAKGGDGVELRGGEDLARELNAKFALPNIAPDDANLQLVYGDIAAIPASRTKLAAFLARRFTNCAVTWQATLFDLPWKHIWTLNIDDTLQRAAPGGLSRKLNSYSWNDPFRVRSLDGDDLQIVHLHGRASTIDPGSSEIRGIIFSLPEYASRSEITPGWHAEFRSEFVRKPFIICGSRLKDEYDLATVLAFGNRSRERGGCPSFVVLRDFAPGEVARFRRQGLIPVSSTGEQFFTVLRAEFNSWRRLHSSDSSYIHNAAIELHSKFHRLKLTVKLPERPIDFYSEAESQWYHITENLDAELPGLAESIGWLTDTSRLPKGCLVSGGPVSGKTTFALRIAHGLAERGYEVWNFRGEEEFESELLITYLESVRRCAFVFDDCADFSGAIRALINGAAAKNLPLRIIATSDKKRSRGVRFDLREANIFPMETEPVRREVFDRIFEKRREKGRLGRCAGQNINAAWTEFKQHYNHKLLEWLESLEAAIPFQQALTRVLAGGLAGGAQLRAMVLATAAVHRSGYSLLFDHADSILGSHQIEEAVTPPSDLSSIAYLDEKGVRLRSHSFAARVWAESTLDEKYRTTLHLARLLAPLVVPQTIRRRTYAYRTLRELMDCDAVRRDLRERANSWYEELLPALGWNARYWEQRALLALKERRDDIAYSYAREALSKQPRDAFPHTTLGTVCLNIAIRRGGSVGLDRYWEGTRALDASRRLAIERANEWEHPYVTFFTYTIRAYPLFPEASERIASEWNRWMREAKQSRLFGFDDEGRSMLDRYQTEWLKLAVGPE